jgi:hypothetical protein
VAGVGPVTGVQDGSGVAGHEVGSSR